MIREARTIINEQLIRELGKIKITKKNIEWNLETSKSSRKLTRELLDNGEVGGALAYPVVLRLREIMIIKNLLNDKGTNNKELKGVIREITGSLEIYEEYRKVKNKVHTKKKLSSEVLKRVMEVTEELSSEVRGLLNGKE